MRKIVLSLCSALSIYLFLFMPFTLLAKNKGQLPPGEVIFVIDESGSMGDEINEVKAHVTHIANQLGDVIDFQLGLIGFGGQESNPRMVIPLTHEINTFSDALDQLSARGGIEPGFSATVLALSDEMGFRPGAGTCVIMITDEDADVISETQADALSALEHRNAIFLGVVDPNRGNTKDQYGPNHGSLAQQTGGQLFNIVDFRANAQPVLSAILDQCADGIISPQPSTLVLDPPTDTIKVSDTITIDLLVNQVIDLRSIQVQLEFNTDVLKLVDADQDTDGLQLHAGHCPQPPIGLVNQADNDTGIIQYAVSSFGASCNANPTDLVASMTFQAHHEGKSSIKLTHWGLANSLGQAITVDHTMDSSITVESTSSPTGSAEGMIRLIGRDAHWQHGQPYYDGATVTLTDHNDTIIATGNTDAAGDYALNDIPVGTYTITAQLELYLFSQKRVTIEADETTTLPDLVLWPGDNSGDGNVNLLDLLPLFHLFNANESFAAGIRCATPPTWDPVAEAEQRKIDFNADCQVDVGDLALHSSTIAAFFAGNGSSIAPNVPIVPLPPASSALAPTPWEE